MATAVSITIVADGNGAKPAMLDLADGFDQVKKKASDAGTAGKKAMDDMGSGADRAGLALRNIDRIFGVNLPRGLTSVIAQSKVLNATLNAMFIGTSIGVAIPALTGIYTKLVDITSGLGGNTAAAQQFAATMVKSNYEVMASFNGPIQGMQKLQVALQTATTARNNMSKPQQQQGSTLNDIKDVTSPGLVGAGIALYQQYANIEKSSEVEHQATTLVIEDLKKLQQYYVSSSQSQIEASNSVTTIGLDGYAKINATAEGSAKLATDLYNRTKAGDADAEMKYNETTTKIYAQAADEKIRLARQNTDQIAALQAAAQQADLTGVALIMAKEQEELDQKKRNYQNALLSDTEYAAERVAIEQKASNEITKIRIQWDEDAAKAELQTASDNSTGLVKIELDTQTKIGELRLKFEKDFPSKPPVQATPEQNRAAAAQDLQNMITQAAANGSAQREKILREEDASTTALIRSTGEEGLTGYAKIEMDTEAKIAELRQKFLAEYPGFIPDPSDPENLTLFADWIHSAANLAASVGAIYDGANRERERQQADMLQTTSKAEEQAAIAVVPEWQRGMAQIVDAYQERSREITANEKLLLQNLEVGSVDYLDVESDTQRQRAALWTQTNAQIRDEHQKMVDDLASQLQSWGDDLFNGQLGQHILDAVKHLFYQILANWLLTLNQMGTASGGNGAGGGLLGGIFGGLFKNLFGGSGSSSSGGSGWSSSLSTQIPGAAGSDGFGGSSSTVGNAGTLGGLASLFGGSSGSSAITGGDPWGFSGSTGSGLDLSALGLSSGTGTAGAVAAQNSNVLQTNSILGALTNGSLSKIMPNGFSLGKLGISGPQLGMLGIGVGLTGAMNAYSNGSPLEGGITGALGGIMTGFAIGGPIGAGVGALMFLGGILSGIFGKNAKKHQAEDMAAGYEQQIQAAHDQYMQHSLDYNSALNTLDQIDKQAQAQMFALGGPGKGVFWGEIDWRVNQAKTEVEATEKERGRRGAIDYQAPEFHTGGYIGPSLKSNEVMIKAKVGEMVMNPTATQRNRGSLEAMNAGKTGGSGNGGNVTLVIQAIDVGSFRTWLRGSGAAREIRDALLLEPQGGS